MPADALLALEPRKTPVQARSTVTVESISEATIQVLLSHGAERLTTTRVAERAGVSVGTLYRYYPNKRSLLFAVLENHLNKVAARVEAVCESGRHKPLAGVYCGLGQQISKTSSLCSLRRSVGITHAG
jgi:AcrR family transcriptional regulator